MTGKPAPVLSPEFLSVIMSTAFGLRGIFSVAIRVASINVFFNSRWLSPTGIFTKKTGTPVSWQIGLSVSLAIFIFSRIIPRDDLAIEPSTSLEWADFKAPSISGGREVATFL